MAGFNIQAELRSMRAEQREDFKELSAKVDLLHVAFGAHEAKDMGLFNDQDQRIAVVEAAHKRSKWAIRTALGALLIAAVDFFVRPFVNP